MPPKSSHSPYSILLLQKLLALRDAVSPLTLVLDTRAAPACALLDDFMLRARAAGVRVVYAAGFIARVGRPAHADVLVERRGRPLAVFRDAIRDAVRAQASPAAAGQRVLVIVDSLCQIARTDPLTVAAFASSLVSPAASVVGLYHADEGAERAPVVYGPMPAATHLGPPNAAAGKPPPLRVLCHLATAVLRVQPLRQEVALKRARDRSEEAPLFDLWGAALAGGRAGSRSNTKTGTTTATPDNPSDLLDTYRDSMLLTMELRRRSGRSVVERFVLGFGRQQKQAAPCSDIQVLADHPLFAAPPDPVHPAADDDNGAGNDDTTDTDQPASTFNLGLTAKQRHDRAGIVLPYFDAQTDIGGAGEGGRILYDMGREDDFDEEEDEI